MTTSRTADTKPRSFRYHCCIILCSLLALLVQQPRVTEAQTGAPMLDTAAEIHHLLQTISTSACRFKRNGTWHEAAAAARHIERKYQAVQARGLITSTEDFIAHAATKSSITGTEYLVQCGTEDAVPSARWLQDSLAALRSHAERARRPEQTP